MQGLPTELQEKILFSLTKPKDLYQACSSSRQNRAICSASVFWREKFRRENLPLLEEGNDVASWLNIYRRSIRAAQIANEQVSRGKTVEVDLSKVSDINVLLLPETERAMKYYWAESRGDRARYFLLLEPVYKTSVYEYWVNRKTDSAWTNLIMPVSRNKVVLAEKDVWYIIYELAFLGYPF